MMRIEQRRFEAARWAGLALALGGGLMAAVWLVFTHVHGPTSYNEERAVLGGSMFFWGTLLGGPPNLLVGLGLGLLYPRLALSRRLARWGYGLLLVGLVVPAAIDLAIGALGPPLFVPVAALGAGLLAVGSGPGLSRRSRGVLLAIGLLLGVAFAVALVPLELSDSMKGYRIYGVLAHLLPGLGWVALAASERARPVAVTPEAR